MSGAVQKRKAAQVDAQEQAGASSGVGPEVRGQGEEGLPVDLPPEALQALAAKKNNPFIHFDWSDAKGGYVATSNVPNFEWVILRYAKGLRDQIS